jgi:hypothetical protein
LILLVPVERIELPTFGLQNRCSTAELNRQLIDAQNPALWLLPAATGGPMGQGAVKYQSWGTRATGASGVSALPTARRGRRERRPHALFEAVPVDESRALRRGALDVSARKGAAAGPA